jgi:hypothetical protein
MLSDASAFQRNHTSDILRTLDAAGWVTDRFMLGSSHQRVEWE